MSETQDTVPVPEEESASPAAQEEAQAIVPGQQAPGKQPEFPRLQTATRLLTGLLVIGGEELSKGFEGVHKATESVPEPYPEGLDLQEETTAALVRYLIIGATARGQRRVARGIRSSIRTSIGTFNWIRQQMDWMTDTFLMGPARDPILARRERRRQEILALIREGKQEELASTTLARDTVSDLIDDLLASPVLTELVTEAVGKQGAGLAGVVAQNTRQVSRGADNLTEGIVRRILRRKPRSELPPSPFQGMPQDMYSVDEFELEDENHEQ